MGSDDHRFAQGQRLDDIVSTLGHIAAAGHGPVRQGEVEIHLAKAVAQQDVDLRLASGRLQSLVETG
jgi:hypothetical protein